MLDEAGSPLELDEDDTGEAKMVAAGNTIWYWPSWLVRVTMLPEVTPGAFGCVAFIAWCVGEPLGGVANVATESSEPMLAGRLLYPKLWRVGGLWLGMGMG